MRECDFCHGQAYCSRCLVDNLLRYVCPYCYEVVLSKYVKDII